MLAEIERREICLRHDADGATEPNTCEMNSTSKFEKAEELQNDPECISESIDEDVSLLHQIMSAIPEYPRSKSFNKIRFLQLSDASLKDRHLRLLCQSDKEVFHGQNPTGSLMSHNLERLDLSRNSITGQGAQELSQHLRVCCPSLWWLDLSENQIGDDGIEALATNLILLSDDCIETRDTCSLWGLALRHTNIGDRGAKAIALALKTHNQRHIVKASKETLPANYDDGLQNLDLSYNSIGPNGAHALAESVRSSTLRELLIYGNPIQDAGAQSFREMLLSERDPPLLQRLGLDVATVSPELRSQIMRDLQFSPQLTDQNERKGTRNETSDDQDVSLDSVSLSSIAEVPEGHKTVSDDETAEETVPPCAFILTFLTECIPGMNAKQRKPYEFLPDS